MKSPINILQHASVFRSSIVSQNDQLLDAKKFIVLDAKTIVLSIYCVELVFWISCSHHLCLSSQLFVLKSVAIATQFGFSLKMSTLTPMKLLSRRQHILGCCWCVICLFSDIQLTCIFQKFYAFTFNVNDKEQLSSIIFSNLGDIIVLLF